MHIIRVIGRICYWKMTLIPLNYRYYSHKWYNTKYSKWPLSLRPLSHKNPCTRWSRTFPRTTWWKSCCLDSRWSNIQHETLYKIFRWNCNSLSGPNPASNNFRFRFRRRWNCIRNSLIRSCRSLPQFEPSLASNEGKKTLQKTHKFILPSLYVDSTADAG